MGFFNKQLSLFVPTHIPSEVAILMLCIWKDVGVRKISAKGIRNMQEGSFKNMHSGAHQAL